jgi:O-antigen/teichoic acid export membrane protein/SAM-dependent methyltransferase
MSDLAAFGKPVSADEESHSTRVVGNIFSLATSEIGARAIAFAGTAYLARRLEPTAFGMIGFATAVWAYLALAVTAGFNDIGAREVARRPQDAPAVAVSVALVRLALAVAASIAIGVLVVFLNKPPTVRLVILISSLLFFSLALDMSWVHKGLERNGRVGAALLVGQSLYVGMVLLVVHRPQDVVYVPVAQFSGEIFTALLLAVPILALNKTGVNVYEGLRILKSSGPLTLSRLLRTLIFSSDVVLLGFMAGERAVGLYNAPYRLCYLLLALSVAVQVSYLPPIARASVLGFKQMSVLAGRSMELASSLGIPLTVGGIILAGPLLNAVFGPDYVEGAAAFRLLLLSIGFIFISSVAHNLLLAADRLKIETWIIAAAALLNVGLNLLLIPRYGLVGAAFSTALAEGLILFLTLMTVSRLGIRPGYPSLIRPALAGLLMGASLIGLGRQQHLVLGLVVGTTVFVAALAAMRGVPRDVEIYLRRFAMLGTVVYERLRRLVHYWRGPTPQQIAEARSLLADREYYQLFDDRYRAVPDPGESDKALISQNGRRALIYRDFERLRRDGLIPEAGARLLELGCGEGQNAAYFAGLGLRVTGVDISPTAIQRATRLAAEQHLSMDFRVADVLDLSGFADGTFDMATDIGCLHMLVRDEHRRRYLRSVRRVLRPGGVFFLFEAAAARDVSVVDEETAILRHVTLVQKRWIAEQGRFVEVRGVGFRSASLPQYRRELEAAGFEVVRAHRGWGRHRRFATLLARAR